MYRHHVQCRSFSGVTGNKLLATDRSGQLVHVSGRGGGVVGNHHFPHSSVRVAVNIRRDEVSFFLHIYLFLTKYFCLHLLLLLNRDYWYCLSVPNLYHSLLVTRQQLDLVDIWCQILTTSFLEARTARQRNYQDKSMSYYRSFYLYPFYRFYFIIRIPPVSHEQM